VPLDAVLIQFHWPSNFTTYRVIQEESAILWEMIVCVIISKKVHINMCPIFDGYGVMGIFKFPYTPSCEPRLTEPAGAASADS
jgi:hypothetical protein